MQSDDDSKLPVLSKPKMLDGEMSESVKSQSDVAQRRQVGRLFGGAVISAIALSKSTAHAADVSIGAAATLCLDSFKNLRDYRGSANTVFVSGYMRDDRPSGIAGLFTVDPTDNKSDDDHGIIIVDVLGRRWKRAYSGLVDVKWFGAKGDGVHNDAPIVSAMIKLGYMPFFSDGTYFFAEPVYVTFDKPNALRISGTSLAGYTGVSPYGATLIGADGLEAFFVFTKTNLAVPGEFAFECTNINFQGKNRVGSALKNIIGGGPARPFIVRNCTFQGFSFAAIVSDITKFGLPTGLCTVAIKENNFTSNKLALYAGGQSAIMGLDFSDNVCEQNHGGIFSTKLGMSGTIRISDNLLEGQPNPIILDVGLANIEIARNYFEQNSGAVMSVVCTNIKTTVRVHNNFLLDCKGFARFHNCELHSSQNFDVDGVMMVANALGGKSVINNSGLVYPNSLLENTLSFDPGFMQVKTIVPENIANRAWLAISGNRFQDTPAGVLGVQTVIGQSVAMPYIVSLKRGDRIVALALCRIKEKVKSNIHVQIYNDHKKLIGQTSPTRIGPMAKSDWVFVAHTAQVTAASEAGGFVQWAVSDTCDITDTFVYKIDTAQLDTPIQIFLPAQPQINDFLICEQTGIVGTMSIVDTLIFSATPRIGFGDNAVYELNVLAGGSAAVLMGVIVVSTTLVAGVPARQIELHSLFETSSATKGFKVSAVFWDGVNESIKQNGPELTSRIRIKIDGYSLGHVGEGQIVKLTKKI